LKEFQNGDKIKTESGGELEVLEKLGEGGQGVVYKVRYNGKEMALKWYFGFEDEEKANKFYNNLKNNIDKKAPTDAFLWPLEITEKSEETAKDGRKRVCFGYLMELRPPEYKDFSAFLLAKEHFSGIGALTNAALRIIEGFRTLHQKGFSYQDLNDGNFFVNPRTGDVLICDNDNVSEYGEASGIAGKYGYMAPEIVTGEGKPSKKTDWFSLAVVLYMMLFLNHPLEGKKTMCPCLTEEYERKFYGSEPVFVYDPDDASNRPVRGVHVNEIKLWKLYPKFVREEFQKAFSKKCMTKDGADNRVMEKEWQEVFVRLRDATVRCPSCGNETFIDMEQQSCKCIDCGRELRRPPVLKVKKHNVALAPDRKIYACHVMGYDDDNFKDIKGEAVMSKSTPPVLGLKNLSGRTWELTLPSGSVRTCGDGQATRLVRGLKIKFENNTTGEIV